MKKKGLTLIELLAVIVVLGIIALISVPQVVKVVKKSKEEAFIASLENLIKSFEVMNSDDASNAYEQIDVTNPDLPKSNEEFLAGEVGYNANRQIEVRYVTNGDYCAVGTSGNFQITEGNCSTLDVTGPVISGVVVVPSKYTATVKVNATDTETAISKYQYSINGGDFIEASSKDFVIEDLESDKKYTLIVRVTNETGAYTDWKTSFTTLAIEMPVVTISPSGWASTKTVTITYPTGYSNYYNKNGTGWTKVDDDTVVLEFNEKGFVVVMVSDDKTVKESITYNVEKLDNDFPTCTMVVTDADTWTSYKTLRIIGRDGSSGIYGIQAPGENYFSVGGEIRRKITHVGTYSATVKDNSGKTGSCTLAVDKVDSTGPLNVMANIVSTTTSTIVVEGTAIDSETGIVKYEFRLDDGDYIDNGTSNIYTFEGVRTGSHTVQVRVTNGVGIQVESEKVSAEADTIKLPTYSVAPEGWATQKTVVISYPTRQPTYRYEYTTDGNTWNIVTTGVTKTVDFTKNGFVIARIFDGTNYFTAATFNVTQVDSTAPFITNVETSKTTNSITIGITANDGESGIVDYTFKLVGMGKEESVSSTLTAKTFTGLLTGTYKVQGTVTNKVGLESKTDEFTITLDEIAEPTCSSISDTWETSKSITITYPASTSGLARTYSVNNGTWQTASAMTVSHTFTAPGVIAAKVSDGTNTKTKTCNVTKVDGTDPIVDEVYSGTRIYNDPNFSSSYNSTSLYNNAGNGAVTLSRVSMSSDYGSYALKLVTTGSASPGWGGFTFQTPTSAGQVLVTRIVAKIPSGYRIEFASNSTGNGSSGYWLTSQEGTGAWTQYIYVLKCGSSGTFSTTNFFYLNGGSTPTSSSPLTWYVAYATTYSSADYDASNAIIFQATDPESGIVGYGINQSSSSQPSFTAASGETFSKVVEGFTSNGDYYVWVKNGAGRVNKKLIKVNRIDTTPPSCTWSNPASAAISEGGQTTFNLTCTDTGGITKGNYTASSLRNYLSATSGLTISDVTRSGSTTSYVYTVTVTAQNSPGMKTLKLAANVLADGAGNYNTAVESPAVTINPAVVTLSDFLVTSENPALYGRIVYQSSRDGANQKFRVRSGVYTTSNGGWRCDRFAIRIVINGSEIVKNGTMKDAISSGTCPALGKNTMYWYPGGSSWTDWYSYNDTRTSGTTSASFEYWDTGWDTRTTATLGSRDNHEKFKVYNANFNIIPYSW